MESCDDLSWVDTLEESGNWSDCEPDSRAHVRVVLDVTDVLVSPSSVITELCEVSSLCSDQEFLEPQSFCFSRKRAHCCTDTREEMRYEGSPVKALPLSRRRMTPPTSVQNSYTSHVRDHGSYEEEGRGWNAREGTIVARTKQYQERSYSVKVRVEEFGRTVGTRGCGCGSQANPERSKRRARAQDLRNFRLQRHELLGGGLVQMGQIRKSAVETRVVGICKRWMAAASPGTADSQLEPN